ncbi:MAG: shikimate dehydrogenase [Clostridia bacterium]|nr:shikimate dehydrogenase [Clostridia bacterium]
MIKLAVVGDPIEHSLSPLVHGGAMDFIGAEYAYEKVQVKKGELPDFLSYAKEKGMNGFNLTMPHKVDILEYLDEIDDEARFFSSVNTVKIMDGQLLGFNTDAMGYVMALKSKGYSFQNSRVVILGAGGVVRTLALKAARLGATDIRICNRTVEKAEEIARLVNARTGVSVSAEEFSLERIVNAGKTCDILINATPLGMHGVERDFEDLSFLEVLPKTTLVSDLIYNPAKTKLLEKAERLGLTTLNGLGMLIYQGILADEIYLAQTLEKEKIYEAVSKKINDEVGL